MIKHTRLILIVGAVFALALATAAFAGQWYVVKHKSGAMAVFDQKPGPGWTVESGPYDSKTAAARAGGIDPQAEPKVKPIAALSLSDDADKYYVAKHKLGGMVVTDDASPGPDWTIVGGPFDNKEAAARSAGLDAPTETVEPAEATVQAGKWYVVKHKLGNSAVINYKTGADWTVLDGPYDTKESALRAHPEAAETAQKSYVKPPKM